MKYLKLTGIFFALAVICWAVVILANPAGLYVELHFAAITFSITSVCFLALTICKAIWKNASPYRIFAIADSVIGAGVLIYAIYDIITDTGWFAGLLGALLILFVIPIILILLIIDLILWLMHRKKEKATLPTAPEDSVIPWVNNIEETDKTNMSSNQSECILEKYKDDN